MKDCVNCTRKSWVQLESDRTKVVMKCPVINKDITTADSVVRANECNFYKEKK